MKSDLLFKTRHVGIGLIVIRRQHLGLMLSGDQCGFKLTNLVSKRRRVNFEQDRVGLYRYVWFDGDCNHLTTDVRRHFHDA